MESTRKMIESIRAVVNEHYPSLKWDINLVEDYDLAEFKCSIEFLAQSRNRIDNSQQIINVIDKMLHYLRDEIIKNELIRELVKDNMQKAYQEGYVQRLTEEKGFYYNTESINKSFNEWINKNERLGN